MPLVRLVLTAHPAMHLTRVDTEITGYGILPSRAVDGFAENTETVEIGDFLIV